MLTQVETAEEGATAQRRERVARPDACSTQIESCELRGGARKGEGGGIDARAAVQSELGEEGGACHELRNTNGGHLRARLTTAIGRQGLNGGCLGRVELVLARRECAWAWGRTSLHQERSRCSSYVQLRSEACVGSSDAMVGWECDL